MRMLHNYLNLEVTKGDTLSFGVEIFDLGQELDAAHFTCKSIHDDVFHIFQKSLNDGIYIDHVEEDDYFYTVRIAPEDTENIEIGKYYYDLQIEVNGDVFTILKGVLTIDYDVMQRGVG